MYSFKSIARVFLFKVLVIYFNEEYNREVYRAEPQAEDNGMQLSILRHSLQGFKSPGLNDVISFYSTQTWLEISHFESDWGWYF